MAEMGKVGMSRREMRYIISGRYGALKGGHLEF